jgi:glutamate-ammonia-ligase adenylyltransferase
MHEISLITGPSPLPLPYDLVRAQAGIESFIRRAAALDPSTTPLAASLPRDEDGAALLRAVFGNSPFLTSALLTEVEFFESVLSTGPDAAFDAVVAKIASIEHAGSGRDGLMRTLRIARRRAALTIGLADIAGIWPVGAVMKALSRFADAVVTAAVDFLIEEAKAGGDLVEIETPGCGYVVMAMGKLGARELNYSSDIDLIVLFDRQRVAYRGRRTLQDRFSKLTRDLVQVIQERTADGYVFRTDLRLRPDPGASPLALPIDAAESYYESVGQNWERAAMIKARPIAGDRAVGEDFLDRIAPFIWRKHLDYAAIADIHSIKRQIDAHGGHHQISVPGHNIKLGRGGIREIEFFAQTQQLIAGGRDARLRDPTTCGALRALAETRRLDRPVADDLIDSYEFLRGLEHRLQMIDDRQTQTLPVDEESLRHVAMFLGEPNAGTLAESVAHHLTLVRNHYAILFEDAPNLGGAGNLVFTGTEDDPETLETLTGLGYSDPSNAAATIRRWHRGTYRAMRSVRARELLTDLVPQLLTALSATVSPDQALARFDEFLERLPAGVQLFSLLFNNPGVRDILAEVMGSAPRLAGHLSRNPAALDGVLGHGFFDPLPPKDVLTAEAAAAIADPRDFQDVLDGVRQWHRDRLFQMGFAMLRQTVAGDDAGAALSDLAEATISTLTDAVVAAFAERHGTIRRAGFCVIAMGRLGSREMTASSDLDLIFVYDNPGGIPASDGAKPLPVSQYFARLSQRLLSALTAQTAEGRLYEIDLRLRPSGVSGPIAVHIDAFGQYQRETAWTWEQMALTRGRVVTGPPRLVEAVDNIRRNVLTRPIDPVALAADVADMRARIEKEFPAREVWSLKYVRGGLIDCEFLCQFMQLRFAAAHPRVLHQSTSGAFRELGAAGCIEADLAQELDAHLHLFHNVYGLLRLCLDREATGPTIPTGLGAALAHVAGAADLAGVERALAQAERRVLTLFEDWVERPASAAQPGYKPGPRSADAPRDRR